MARAAARRTVIVALLLGLAACAAVAGLSDGTLNIIAWIGMGVFVIAALVMVLSRRRS